MKDAFSTVAIGLFLFGGFIFPCSISQLQAQVAFGPIVKYVDNFNPDCIVAADVNEDGKPDLISSHQNPYSGNSLSIFTNKGNGSFAFSSKIESSTPSSVAAAEVNGDGKVDLICANVGADTLSVFTNKGKGGVLFASSSGVGTKPRVVIAADVNADGKIDLVSANNNNSTFGNTLSVLTNNGTGSFVLASTPNADLKSLAAADINGDGYLDLVGASYNYNVVILTNNSKARFTAAASRFIPDAPDNAIMADVNDDGFSDLITANSLSSTLSVLTNNGHGVFPSIANLSIGPGPRSLLAADLNGDGKLDLVAGCVYGNIYTENCLSVLTNDGGGGFQLAATLLTSGPASVVATDVNGDGARDLVAADQALSKFAVFINVPTLKINRSGETLAISWPSSWTGWALQQNTNLNTATWTGFNGVINDDGTNKSVEQPKEGNFLFRLTHP